MKAYLSKVLPVICIVLLVALVAIKWNDNSQHASDVAAFTDCSNQLDSAQSQITLQGGTILTLSNRLITCEAGCATLSNRLQTTETTLSAANEQLINVSQQLTEANAANQQLTRRGLELTNEVTSLSDKFAFTKTSLDQTNSMLAQLQKDYGLLDNRFRRDVAERVTVERKFNNTAELQAQLKYLKTNPAKEISAESIYAGLNVVVRSNGVAQVISPD